MSAYKNLLLIILIAGFIFSFYTGYSSSAPESETGNRNRTVLEIQIDGSINPSTVDYIKTAITKAENEGMEAVLILLDTPGGLLTSTQDIVKDILNSPVPVIVYVYPKGASATSAGVFITMSANIAVMSPGTSIGAAHPVSIGQRQRSPDQSKDEKNGEDAKSQDDIMSEKIENYASSFIEGIAEERGRNVEWAAEAVRKSASITANEAVEKNVVDIVSPDIETLLKDIHGKKVKIGNEQLTLNTENSETQHLEMNLKQKIVDIISTPDIAFLLLSIGSLGILMEFYNPGMIFPGVAGLISLLIGFVSLQILPFNYGGLALLFLGLALFAAEVYVTSYGLLSIGGFIAFVFGALLLFDTPESDMRVGYEVIIATSLALGLFVLFVVYFLTKSFKLPAQGGFEGLREQQGEVLSWEGNKGKVFVQGEYWDAYSDEPLEKGDRIRVIKSEGELRIKVSKLL